MMKEEEEEEKEKGWGGRGWYGGYCLKSFILVFPVCTA